jgi:hypothetical protein
MDIRPFSLDTQMATCAPSRPPRSSRGTSWAARWWHWMRSAGTTTTSPSRAGCPGTRCVRSAVVDKLGATIEELIAMGDRAFVVPGNLPFGCAPFYLRRFRARGSYWDYDPKTGCLAWFNRFAEYHNRLLNGRLDAIRQRHPDVTIVYADWYGAMMSIFRDPAKLGTYSNVSLPLGCY